ncbi:MAG: hypothetical protein C0190_07365 [Thermodesulfobacterium geofontis]|uniref:DUF4390 domain-containing protein n=1 Tax=Thermodesulfobacterium geofontis TaxID=1295609 RepID=A0A2N7PLM6_9BACT|nr:MAG: hypothetical protein C0190_07365 [Thermodesulfobacterium geofontis]PMP94060.1 MAG: hypothetical protein C0169_07015 [Thermodesulfobacterium geofontis]
MKILKVFFLLLVFLIFSESYALEIKKLRGYLYEKNILLSIFYKDFPFQELVLALKEQKNPILIEYEFEIYRKRFLLKDILHKEKYYQKLYYNSEKNLYYLEDNFGLKAFEKPENAILSVMNLESYPLRYTFIPEKNSLNLKIKITITYITHLSEDLKYTKKHHSKKIETEKTIWINELLEKF